MKQWCKIFMTIFFYTILLCIWQTKLFAEYSADCIIIEGCNWIYLSVPLIYWHNDTMMNWMYLVELEFKGLKKSKDFYSYNWQTRISSDGWLLILWMMILQKNPLELHWLTKKLLFHTLSLKYFRMTCKSRNFPFA